MELLTFNADRFVLELGGIGVAMTAGSRLSPRAVLVNWLKSHRSFNTRDDRLKHVCVDKHPHLKGYFLLNFGGRELMFWFKSLIARCIRETLESGVSCEVILRHTDAFTNLHFVDATAQEFIPINTATATKFLEDKRCGVRPTGHTGKNIGARGASSNEAAQSLETTAANLIQYFREFKPARLVDEHVSTEPQRPESLAGASPSPGSLRPNPDNPFSIENASGLMHEESLKQGREDVITAISNGNNLSQDSLAFAVANTTNPFMVPNSVFTRASTNGCPPNKYIRTELQPVLPAQVASSSAISIDARLEFQNLRHRTGCTWADQYLDMDDLGVCACAFRHCQGNPERGKVYKFMMERKPAEHT